jgi:hypothetical protein
MTPRTSLNEYERMPRSSPTAITNKYYDDIHEKHKQILPRVCSILIRL